MNKEMRNRSVKSFLDHTHTMIVSLFHGPCAVVAKEITERPLSVFTAYVSVFLSESHANVLVTSLCNIFSASGGTGLVIFCKVLF